MTITFRLPSTLLNAVEAKAAEYGLEHGISEFFRKAYKAWLRAGKPVIQEEKSLVCDKRVTVRVHIEASGDELRAAATWYLEVKAPEVEARFPKVAPFVPPNVKYIVETEKEG